MRFIYFLFLSFCLVSTSYATTDVLSSTPDSLKKWADWVMFDHPDYTCPHESRSNTYRCVFPAQLSMDINKESAKFTLNVRNERADWVALVGNHTYWPQNVIAGEKLVPVTLHHGAPSVYLEKGSHTITGSLQWNYRPNNIPVPYSVALFKLTIDGEEIKHPKRNGESFISTETKTYEPLYMEKDSLEIKAFRNIHDGIPATITTKLKLTVTGKQRDEVIPSPLLEGNILSNLQAGGLQAHLNTDTNKLHISVQAGTWWITLQERTPDKLVKLSMNEQEYPWKEELWSFMPDTNLRHLKVSGAKSINPSQTDMPPNWKRNATYLMKKGRSLTFTEERRGEAQVQENRINLNRTAWVGIDGDDVTFADQLNGTLSESWDIAFSGGNLQRAEINGALQPISKREKGKTAIEVRQSNINLSTVAHRGDGVNILGVLTLPANGWSTDITGASTTINTAPGWRIMQIWSSGKENGTWFGQWTLYDVFSLLLVSLAIAKLWNIKWGIFSFVSVGLIFHESSGLAFIILMIIATVALMRVIPHGRLFKFVRVVHLFTLFAFVIFLLPFTVEHIRYAMYPQLDTKGTYNMGYQQERYFRGHVKKHEMPAAMDMISGDGRMRRLAKESFSAVANSPSTLGMMAEEIYDMEPQKLNTSFDPNASLPTGVGLPNWQWKKANIHWKIPVAENEQVTIWLLTPWMYRLIELLKVTLLGILAIRLMLTEIPKKWNLANFRKAVPLGLLAILLAAQPAQAEMPSPQLLDQLKSRLMRQAECLPNCADYARGVLNMTENEVSLSLNVAVIEESIVPLPQLGYPWQPSKVTVKGKDEAILLRDGNDLKILLPKGTHQIQMDGYMPEVQDANFYFPLPPRDFKATISGWNMQGLDREGNVNKNLRFTKSITKQSTKDKKTKNTSTKLTYIPPYVEVTRTLNLGHEWIITTRIRLHHGSGAEIQYPLLEGEKLLNSPFKIKDGKVTVPLSRNQRQQVFSTVLEQKDIVKLQAPETNLWHENWVVRPSALWNVQHHGISPVYRSRHNTLELKWRPFANEKVALTINKPESINGQTITLHHGTLDIHPGEKLTENKLELLLETTEPQDYVFALPEKAKLQTLQLNHRNIPLSQNGRKVTLALPYGKHTVQAVWHEEGDKLIMKTPDMNLNIPATNLTVKLHTPSHRFALFTYGGWGPAVLLWSILLAYALLSFVLSKVKLVPLKGWQWFILAIGFSQVHPLALIVPFGCLIILGLKKQYANKLGHISFNALQVVLVILVFAALTGTLEAIRIGLLGGAETYVTGNGSGKHLLQWYTDRTDGSMPCFLAIMPPSWLYQWVIMLFWATWTAYLFVDKIALWTWECFSAHGYWRRNPSQPAKKKATDKKKK
jgi:hypothetical protein